MNWLCLSVTETEAGFVALFRADTADKHFADMPCLAGDFIPGQKYKMVMTIINEPETSGTQGEKDHGEAGS